MERSSQRRDNSPGEGTRSETTLPLSSVLGRIMSSWGTPEEVGLWLLKTRWADVCPEVWAQDIRPEALDVTGKLTVRVVSAPGVAMEIQRKGRRWRMLLEGSKRVSEYAINDVVLADPYQRRHARQAGKDSRV